MEQRLDNAMRGVVLVCITILSEVEIAGKCIQISNDNRATDTSSYQDTSILCKASLTHEALTLERLQCVLAP